jgi:hypothetical protein
VLRDAGRPFAARGGVAVNVPEWVAPVWLGFLLGAVVALWLLGGLP